MEQSIYLAKVIGLFGAISTLIIIARYKYHNTMEDNAANIPSLIYSSGYLFLLLGILIVVKHNLWTTDWRVIITIIGWTLLLKAFMRILIPEKVTTLIAKKKSDKRFFIAELIVLIISLYLLYKGFF